MFEKQSVIPNPLAAFFQEALGGSLSLCKTLKLLEMINAQIESNPDKYHKEILKGVSHFLFNIPDDFCHHRTVRHLMRILCSTYEFQNQIKNKLKSEENKRHIFLKVLQTDVLSAAGAKKVLAILITFNLLKENETFQKKHVLKAIHEILSAVHDIQGSFYSYRDPLSPILTAYIEIKKMRGSDWEPLEIQKLKGQLPLILKNNIGYLSHPLFLPHNEEEICRNIISLAKELKYVRDLPQMMISFQEQTHDRLRFCVIVLRLLKKTTLPLQTLMAGLPPSIGFIPLRVDRVGDIRQKYYKEANVFLLEVESSLFLRHNDTVDLKSARNYLAEVLKKLIGRFRDYNGGFLIQQSQQLKLIKKALGKRGLLYGGLIESLFYSLTPSAVQATLYPESGKLLFALFLQMLKLSLRNHGFIIKKQREAGFLAVVIKVSSQQLKELLLAEISLFTHNITHGSIVVEGHTYFCFLQTNPPPAEDLYIDLKEKLRKWSAEGAFCFSTHTTKQVLKINFQDGDPPSLNPQMSTDLRCQTLCKALFEGLTRLTAKGNYELAGAQEVKISPCRKIYTFTLRPMKWSNGEEVLASHFEISWKKALSPSSSCLRPELFFVIKGAYNARRGTLSPDEIGIKAVDNKTLVVELEHPLPSFLQLVASSFYSPLYGEGEEPRVFNGPFILSRWERGKILSLTSNPFYWDSKSVKLDGIDISMIKDSHTPFALFEQGELDMVGDPFSTLHWETLKKYKQQPQLKKKKVMRVYWIFLNTQKFPLNNLKLRRALCYALNRETLLDSILLGQSCHFSPLPKGLSLLDPQKNALSWDPREARVLFEESLKELGLTRKTFPPLTITCAETEKERALARTILKQWEDLFEIKIQIKGLEWNAYCRAFDKKETQIGGFFRSALYKDPLLYLGFFREASSYFFNPSAWEDKPFQQLVEKAMAATNEEERNGFMREAERLLIAHMPVIPLYEHTYYYMAKENLKGVSISDLGYIDFKESYFETVRNEKKK